MDNIDIIENELYKFDREMGDKIIGIDEVGRGPLAGPVVAGAAILREYSDVLTPINDSKKLTEAKREKLYDVIFEHFYVGIGESSPKEIDEMNILNATFLAMRRAVADLQAKYQVATGEILDMSKYLTLVDGNFAIREYAYNQKSVVKGDGKSLSIAAASIAAKVYRDRLMIALDDKYPEYGFKKNKGYGTKVHTKALLAYGATPIHRESFLTSILVQNPTLF